MKTKQPVEKCYPVIHTDKHEIFTFVERVKNEVVICVGNQVICDKVTKTVEEALAYVSGYNWQLLTNLVCLVSERVYEQKKLQEQLAKQSKKSKK